MDNFEDSPEAYQHLAFYHKRKPRLTKALDLENLVNNRSATFEVEGESMEDMSLHDDDEDLQGLETGSYLTSFLTKGVGKAKDVKTLEALAEMDFVSEYFPDIEKDMVSIHPLNLVKKQVVSPGTGVKVPENGKVFVHYLALCEGNDEPHDSTVLRNSPAIVDMRNPEVLPGLYVAIASMELKEVSKFIVKSDLAYGKMGCPPLIPPGADVLFIVEVLHVIDENLLKSPLYMTAEERARLPFGDILETATRLQTDGNGHYTNHNLWYAVKKYRKAVTILEDYPIVSKVDEDNRCQLLHTLYANLAQCYLKLAKPAQACAACKLGMRHAKGKNSLKLLFRFSKAKLQLKDLDGALKLCNQGLELDSKNRDLKNLLAQINFEQNSVSASSKKMYQNMFRQ